MKENLENYFASLNNWDTVITCGFVIFFTIVTHLLLEKWFPSSKTGSSGSSSTVD